MIFKWLEVLTNAGKTEHLAAILAGPFANGEIFTTRFRFTDPFLGTVMASIGEFSGHHRGVRRLWIRGRRRRRSLLRRRR
jgi:hypothetical protein